MSIPSHYYSGLSNKNTKEQLRELKKSKNSYKNKIYHTRKKMPSFKSKKSRHVVEFEKKYCVKITDLKNVAKVTGVPVQQLELIIKKGQGAYYSSGSRPNQTAHSWAYARLASTLLKHNAYRVDKHILNNANVNIKPPPKRKCVQDKKSKKTKKPRRQQGGKNIIDCSKINEKNEAKHKQCQRKSDGKVFKLPRRFNKTQCKKARGFTMRSSCAIYKK